MVCIFEFERVCCGVCIVVRGCAFCVVRTLVRHCCCLISNEARPQPKFEFKAIKHIHTQHAHTHTTHANSSAFKHTAHIQTCAHSAQHTYRVCTLMHTQTAQHITKHTAHMSVNTHSAHTRTDTQHTAQHTEHTHTCTHAHMYNIGRNKGNRKR